jgi:hypothetical protein
MGIFRPFGVSFHIKNEIGLINILHYNPFRPGPQIFLYVGVLFVDIVREVLEHYSHAAAGRKEAPEFDYLTSLGGTCRTTQSKEESE